MIFPVLVSPLHLLGAVFGIGPNFGRSNGNGQPEININIKTENNTTNSSNGNAVGSDLPCKCRY
ncbi:hypothetical protein HX819_25280 [Pseudomonas sp. D6002]|uniref:hypothetical protein n=1 Tax=unclassified Pseudomonas TaxID=196821 RepID=UPI0015A10DFE|nr:MULTISPECIES: hypothetical protein [unclassified Pseudomonas]MBT1267391.1 hypothetical protein [Pseudomonas sp. VS38]NVZ98218.1 hypothetical protein [Pseudomonas sp. B6001]NWB17765.1 hypothetical protein [Pseudomonas sp. D6002]NWD01028.1 hypothetical protein [Pseudomonas sp. P7779]